MEGTEERSEARQLVGHGGCVNRFPSEADGRGLGGGALEGLDVGILVGERNGEGATELLLEPLRESLVGAAGAVEQLPGLKVEQNEPAHHVRFCPGETVRTSQEGR